MALVCLDHHRLADLLPDLGAHERVDREHDHSVARAALWRARREGWLVVIPAPALAEVHTGRYDHARFDRVINAVDMLIDTTAERAKQAGRLRSASCVLDVVDAILVAEALAMPPALIMTSDPDDIRALVEVVSATDRIRIIAV